MRIFITGGTGYIGSALCRRWVEAGHELRALVRESSRTEELRALGVECRVAEITDRSSLAREMSSSECIVHVAAELDLDAPPARIHRTNVEGSEAVAAAAYEIGAKRFLSVSSMAYFGGSPDDGRTATEATPPRLPLATHYSATKHAGEEAIRAWAERGLPVVTVYPSLVYGPPGKGRGAHGLLRSLLAERMPAIVGGDRKTSWIFLEDLVTAIDAVMERGEIGGSWLLAGDVITIEEVVRLTCELGGVRLPRLRLPLWSTEPLVAIAAPIARLLGRRLPVTPQQLLSLRRHWNFDDRAAREAFDWRPRSLAEGLPPTIAHLLKR